MEPSVLRPVDNKKGKFRKILFQILGLAVIIFLGWYLYKNQDSFQAIKNISWQQIVLIVLLDFAAFFVNAVMNYFMLKRLEPRISFIDCYGLQYANSMLNKILPTIGGGATFKALFLKRKYDLPYSQFVSVITGLYIISFITTSLLGLICILIIYLQLRIMNWVLVLAFILFLLPSLGIIIFTPKIPESDKRIVKTLSRVITGWNTIKQDKRSLLFYALCFLILLFLTAAQTMVSYQALAVKTSFVPMLLLSSTTIILQVLSFTPDGIGIKEGIFVFTGNLVQIPDNILVLGSLVVRAVTMVTTGIIGAICYLILLREITKIEKEPDLLHARGH